MAQLKDLIVNGTSRFIGPVYTNSGMVAFGTCSTAAGTAAKVVTIDDPSWTLKVGNIIGVKATTSNTASNVTLNVNGTGAKSIYYDTYVYTGSTTAYTTKANAVTYFIYDGTYWVWIDCSWNLDSNTYTSAYCTTGASTAAKTASLSNYILKDNSYTFISISNANTAQSALTLNINSKGAKPIYINGTASSATNYTLPAGTYIIYYDGTNYQFRTDGKIPNLATVATSGSYNDLSDKPTIPSAITESTVSGWGFTKNTGTYSKPSGGIPKTDLASAVQTSLGKADTALQSHQDISGKANLSGATFTGATQFNNYLKLNAWSGYGSGTANFWYDGNNKFVEIQTATDLKLAGTKVSKEGHTHSYYTKPSGGIPKTDLASAVQTSLGKADTALQSAPVTSVNGQTGAVTITNITGSAGSATNDGNGNNIASTYKPKSLGSKMFTTQDKNGTAIIGSSNDATGASFYFGSVRPTEYTAQWEITYRVKVFCAANSNYRQSATVKMYGTSEVRAGYETNNDIYSTSYRAAYYHNLYSLKSAGYTNGYGHLIGVGLNSATNPTDASLPRTIEVEILDTKNCTFTFFDYALKYANVTGTGSTNFSGLTQWDFASNGHFPNTNNLDRIRLENGRVYAGTGGIMNYGLCCLDKDGRWQSLTTTSGTGTTKTINTSAKFKDPAIILYYSANNAATNGNLVSSTYALYSAYPNLDLRYSTNTTTTAFTGNSPIYIECTFDDNGFWSPTTNCITQTLRDGYYYIYLGNTYSTVYQLSLFAEHPVYYCKGTNLTKKQLPTASASVLGGIKVGDGLSIDTNGVLKVTSGGEASSIEWSGVKNTPTTLAGYGITDATKTQSYTATIPTSGWTSYTGYVTISVNITGITSTDTLIIDINLNGKTITEKQSISENWGNILDIQNANGSITVTASQTPTVSIPIKILAIRR